MNSLHGKKVNKWKVYQVNNKQNNKKQMTSLQENSEEMNSLNSEQLTFSTKKNKKWTVYKAKN